MNRASVLRKSSVRDLLAIAFIAICVYFGFTPLFEMVNGGVTGAVIGASFGAIFMIVLTMYLLNKQTQLEQESKRGEKVFEEKIEFYKSLLQTVNKILDDGALEAAEVNKLSFALVELQMVGGDSTIKAFLPVLEKCNNIFHSSEDDVVEMQDPDRVKVLELLATFSQKCRVDLGIDDIELDKKVFDKAIEEISEGITRKVGNKEYFEGLEGKLNQLKEQGYNEDGVESYRIMMSFFNDKSKGGGCYTTNMAKSGSSFNDSKATPKMQIYMTNPQKRSSGIGIEIKENTGLVDELRQYVLDQLGKEQSTNVQMSLEYKGKERHECHFSPALADEMGVQAYHELLGYITDKIFIACEQRS